MATIERLTATIEQIQMHLQQSAQNANRLEQRIVNLETLDRTEGGSVFTNVVASGTVYGGTSASDDLTLESTNHATKGDVVVNPTGGSFAVGTTAPGYLIHGVSAGNATIAVESTGGRSSFYVKSAGTGDFARVILVQSGGQQYELGLPEDGSGDLVIGDTDLTNHYLTVSTAGNVIVENNLAIGDTEGEGRFRISDGTANHLFGSFQSTGTAHVAIVSSGHSGGLWCESVWRKGLSGTVNIQRKAFTALEEESNVLYADLDVTVQLQNHAGGSITIYQSAGSGTASGLIEMYWIT